MLSKLFAAIAAFAKKNPAIVSWAASMLVTLGAHYGLHLSAGQLVALLTVLLTLTHAGAHVAIAKTRKKAA